MMKSNLNAVLWLILAALLCCGAGCSDSGRWSIGSKIGVLDTSGEPTKTAAAGINTRVGATYSLTQVGILPDRNDINGAAPYVGIGWGDMIGRGKKWGFYSNLGVAFTDSPDVVLRANGTPAADRSFQADLAKEAKDIAENLDGFEVHPVISVGLYFRL
jgi:hypothetical protein